MKAEDAVYVSGEYLRSVGGINDNDAYFAVIKSISDGHKELKIIDHPEVSVYVTKPQFRTNTCKKELEEKSHLDMYRTRLNSMAATLWNAINNPGKWTTPYKVIQQKKMLSNPWVYGADIDYGVHLKMAYNKRNHGNMPIKFDVGFLDIETDVTGTKQVILITYMNSDGQTYVGILKSFFLDHAVQEVEKMWSEKVEPSLRSKLNKDGLKFYTASGGIKLNIKVIDGELELIKWIFDKIHYHKPDFIGVWNIAYDVPYLIERMKFRGVDPANIFCHPDVPLKYRYCDFHEDKGKKGDHMVDRWSWLRLTDYTRWIDYMCLYGRLRKAKPREPSYRLDAIGGKEIGTGKLEFGSGETHHTMQRFHQVEYTVYNIVDVLIMWIMELKNHDVYNMMQLIGVSTLDSFAHQSIQLKNSYYEYLETKNCVPASIGDPIYSPWDYLIHNMGGAVLDPSNASIAVPFIKEDDIALRGTRFACDIDVASAQCGMGASVEKSTPKKLLNCWNTLYYGQDHNTTGNGGCDGAKTLSLGAISSEAPSRRTFRDHPDRE